MLKRAFFERSRRELSLDVSVDVHILLVVEQSSLESQSRGCAKTPHTYGNSPNPCLHYTTLHYALFRLCPLVTLSLVGASRLPNFTDSRKSLSALGDDEQLATTSHEGLEGKETSRSLTLLGHEGRLACRFFRVLHCRKRYTQFWARLLPGASAR